MFVLFGSSGLWMGWISGSRLWLSVVAVGFAAGFFPAVGVSAIVNVGVASSCPVLCGAPGPAGMSDGGWLAFEVTESEQGGRDLNGDGDARDRVLHVYEQGSGRLVNVGLAVFFDELGFGFPPTEVGHMGFEAGRVVFAVDEGEQGRSDLNGDGDVDDLVLHVHDVASGQTTNLGLAVLDGIGNPETDPDWRLGGDLVALGVSEAGQGGGDLNGDGDAVDAVLHVFDAAAEQMSNLGFAMVSPFSVDGGRVAFGVDEESQGQGDLNGDGDAVDDVVHVYEAADGRTRNLRLALFPHAGTGGQLPLEDGLLAFRVPEEAQGQDLNGDGHVGAAYVYGANVLHVYTVETGEIVNVGLATAFNTLIERGRIAFPVDEGDADLNGDGDRFDEALHIYDAVTERITNARLAVRSFFEVVLDGDVAAVSVPERDQERDLNRDGDRNDLVLVAYDLAKGRSTSVRLAVPTSRSVRIAKGTIAFLALESGQGGRDLNGDGDSVDKVAHLYKVQSARTRNTRLAATVDLQFDGSQLATAVPESDHGERDLNGDGDTRDNVLHLYNTARRKIQNLRYAVPDFLSASSFVSFVVDERGQGRRDLNGDRDASDWVHHIYTSRADTSTAGTSRTSPGP